MGEQQVLEIGTITLDRSGWVPWTYVAADNRGGAGVLIPNHASGVYEVRHAERDVKSGFTSVRQVTCASASVKAS